MYNRFATPTSYPPARHAKPASTSKSNPPKSFSINYFDQSKNSSNGTVRRYRSDMLPYRTVTVRQFGTASPAWSSVIAAVAKFWQNVNLLVVLELGLLVRCCFVLRGYVVRLLFVLMVWRMCIIFVRIVILR